MHYIVGTQFVKSGKHLTVYNITSRDEKLIYTFKESTGDKFDMVFEDSIQADKYIATARKEALPDYEAYYASNKG